MPLSYKTDESAAIQAQNQSLSSVELTTVCPASAQPRDGAACPPSTSVNNQETQSESPSPALVQPGDGVADADQVRKAEVTQQDPAVSTSDHLTYETIETVVQPQVETGREQELLPVQDRSSASTSTIEPQCDVEAHGLTDGQGGLPAEPEQPPKTKALVVDDDSSLGNLMKMLLESYGYYCVTAENGKAAQEVLQTYRPDLILLDLFMPVMDGLVFIRWLRETAQDSTPVLVFSSADDRSVAEEALRTGANSFIGKPLQIQGIVQEMKRLVPF